MVTTTEEGTISLAQSMNDVIDTLKQDSFREVLIRKAEALRENYRELVQERQRINAQIGQVALYAQLLNPILISEGIEVIELDGAHVYMPVASKDRTSSIDRMTASHRKQVGPKHKVISSLLATGGQWTIADLTKELYEGGTPFEVDRYQKSVTASLSLGVEEGKWQRVGRGLYAALPRLEGQ